MNQNKQKAKELMHNTTKHLSKTQKLKQAQVQAQYNTSRPKTQFSKLVSTTLTCRPKISTSNKLKMQSNGGKSFAILLSVSKPKSPIRRYQMLL